MKFDLSPVPQNAIIEEATLKVFTFWVNELAYDGISGARIISDWDVDTIESNFPDFDSELYDMEYEDLEEMIPVFDVTETIVDIVELGEANYGFMLYFLVGDPIHELAVLSCDSADPWGRPSLTVTYTEPS